MARKRFYGKSHPKTKDVNATLNFLESISGIATDTKGNNMKLDEQAINYLAMLVNADMKKRVDLQVHAISHGSDYADPTIDVCCVILRFLKTL